MIAPTTHTYMHTYVQGRYGRFVKAEMPLDLPLAQAIIRELGRREIPKAIGTDLPDGKEYYWKDLQDCFYLRTDQQGEYLGTLRIHAKGFECLGYYQTHQPSHRPF